MARHQLNFYGKHRCTSTWSANYAEPPRSSGFEFEYHGNACRLTWRGGWPNRKKMRIHFPGSLTGCAEHLAKMQADVEAILEARRTA